MLSARSAWPEFSRSEGKVGNGGRYWVRTSDLFGVKHARCPAEVAGRSVSCVCERVGSSTHLRPHSHSVGHSALRFDTPGRSRLEPCSSWLDRTQLDEAEHMPLRSAKVHGVRRGTPAGGVIVASPSPQSGFEWSSLS